jgi:hypothetical protein
VDEPQPGWRPGDHILFDLPDGQTVRCRVVDVKDDGTIHVVPEHDVVIRSPFPGDALLRARARKRGKIRS